MSTQDLQIEKVIGETLEKSLPEIVDVVTEKKISEAMGKQAGDLEAIKQELKNLKRKAVKSESYKNAFTQTAVVGIIKEVWANNVSTEKGFWDVANAHLKVMGEGTSLEGAEFVFDQFETDVLRVINDYSLAKYVKMMTLLKGDNTTLPKAVNGVTTTFKGENVDYGTPTEPTTSSLTINMAKATTMTTVTEELLDDTMTVPDLYNLIVEFIGESQAEFLEDKILSGTLTSTATVEGILVNSDVNEITLDAGETVEDIDDDTLVEAVMKIAKKYKRKAGNMKWVMSQYTMGKLMQQLKTTDGSFLYPELRQPTPRLWGYEVVVSDKMPVQDSTEDIAGATCILFGDLRFFVLVRRKGVTIERGYRTGDWQADLQSIKSNTRYGGKCTFGEAFVKITNGASS